MTEDEKVNYWIEHNLANYLKDYKVEGTELKRMISWLRSPSANKNRRQIKKLSVQTALNLSQAWADSLDKKASRVENLSNIETIHTFSNNYTIVKLTGRSAFQREGKLMKHCVSFYNLANQEILSLRDELNNPHCTIEVLEGVVNQVRGVSNTNVDISKRKYVKDYLINHLKKPINDDSASFIGLLNLPNGEFYDLDTDTYPLVLEGDLNLEGYGLARIPSLSCTGELNLKNNELTELPEDYTQIGELNLRRNKISQLPQNFKQTHYLDLSENKIRYLPRDFEQTAHLDLSYNLLLQLPEHFTQTASLYLQNNLLTQLPENFKQTHYLDLSHNRLTHLPKKFKQVNFLNLAYNKIHSLPNNFTQAPGKHLCLTANKLTHLPRNFKQNGHLSLDANKLRVLPKNFKQNGQLHLRANQLIFLPAKFSQTEHSLDLSKNRLFFLPKGFSNSRANLQENFLKIYLTEERLTSIEKVITCVIYAWHRIKLF